MVPPHLQRALWAVYQEGQERGDAPVTDAYLLVQGACRLAIADAEGNAATTERVLRELVGVVDRQRAGAQRQPLARATLTRAGFRGALAAEVNAVVGGARG